jgi:multicomponent Na+:H+ antiporter subunit C
MSLAIAVAVLAGVGTWLVVRGGAVRLILGFILLGHAANLIIIAAGGTWRRDAPIVDGGVTLETMADPLPQAFVLTAIVITFGVTVYLLSLVARIARAPRPARKAAEQQVEQQVEPRAEEVADP